MADNVTTNIANVIKDTVKGNIDVRHTTRTTYNTRGQATKVDGTGLIINTYDPAVLGTEASPKMKSLEPDDVKAIFNDASHDLDSTLLVPNKKYVVSERGVTEKDAEYDSDGDLKYPKQYTVFMYPETDPEEKAKRFAKWGSKAPWIK